MSFGAFMNDNFVNPHNRNTPHSIAVRKARREAEQANRPPPGPSPKVLAGIRRRERKADVALRKHARRAQLIADGRKALELVRTKPIADVLMVVGGSRARLYRAMYAASEAQSQDPLLD
jgi:hypothetical protein